ncbi:hypothetical protein OH76DRAFT_1405789 [Lentinus brumalis]|uniref:Uncharacterized protein n=1 Tax=Lentinus brumalis TaxID=2498619 RepID=A0A371D4M5_9APHY|nr:hypothetical protein OH76DRAFT_1405789 [Polyporus brumalis]
MQILSLTTAFAVLALALIGTANPSFERNQCRRADGSIELREVDGSLLPRDDGCTNANAGGPGCPSRTRIASPRTDRSTRVAPRMGWVARSARPARTAYTTAECHGVGS